MAPLDRDERMGPPSLPTPASVGQNQSQPPQETIEKYKKLKRRYAELQEESNTDSNQSDERNVRMREEKDYLREKLREMETNGSISPSTSPILNSAFHAAPSSQASSSTLPRTLLDPKARTSFENNLREAMDEGDADDDLDPLLTSRHLGPHAKKRGEEERNGLIDGSGTRKAAHKRGPSGGSQVGSSPRLRGKNSTDRRPAEENGDVEMEDVHGPGYSYSRHSSNGARRDRQERDDHGSENSNASNPQSPRRETRSTRGSRGTRNEGNAIAAVAAAAAEAEAAAATTVPPGQPPTNGQQNSRTDASNGGHLTHSSSSTLANALGLAASTQGSASKEPDTISTPPSQGYHVRSPSMESILKVAEAAVAAQNAAAASQTAKAAASSVIQSNADVDPNLDPSLFSPSKNGGVSNASSASSSKPPSVNTAVANATASTSATPSSASATPTSSLSNNPYLSLSTNLLPRTGTSSTTPTGHPMLIPYPMYYPPPPPPGTPGTPNSPQYPMPYNPYYYLAAGANGMYPAPVQFPPAPPTQQQRAAPEPQRPKAKRLKAHTVTTRSFSIPMVPRDKKNKPMLPLNVGIMTVISLGDVCMREHFHTERYIFPVGYEVTRRYLSTVDPTIEVVYHCTILDGGDGPKFQIIPSDRPDKPIIAGTATGAWSNIVKQANAIRNRQHSNSVSGPDFFGLGQNTIKHLIQELPNADRLRDYVWQNFIEGGPLGGRHAAVIPALPEEYDASMPIGAYYPKRDTTSDPNVPRGLSHYPQHIIAQAEAQKAQKLAAQRMQGQAIAGPSGSNAPSSSSSQQSAGPSQNAQSGQPPMLVSLGGSANELSIHEYQPPQPPPQAQSVSQGPERRTTRSTTSGAVPKGHHTRSGSRGNAQQPPQTSSAPPPVPPSLNADGTNPTTFADIMNAYPAPGVQAPASNHTSTSGS